MTAMTNAETFWTFTRREAIQKGLRAHRFLDIIWVNDIHAHATWEIHFTRDGKFKQATRTEENHPTRRARSVAALVKEYDLTEQARQVQATVAAAHKFNAEHGVAA